MLLHWQDWSPHPRRTAAPSACATTTWLWRADGNDRAIVQIPPDPCAWGRERWLAIREEQLAAIRQRGADTLLTVSHLCQREWCDVPNDDLAVRNYISLIAEAIGCEPTYETDSLGR